MCRCVCVGRQLVHATAEGANLLPHMPQVGTEFTQHAEHLIQPGRRGRSQSARARSSTERPLVWRLRADHVHIGLLGLMRPDPASAHRHGLVDCLLARPRKLEAVGGIELRVQVVLRRRRAPDTGAKLPVHWRTGVAEDHAIGIRLTVLLREIQVHEAFRRDQRDGQPAEELEALIPVQRKAVPACLGCEGGYGSPVWHPVVLHSDVTCHSTLD
mmetsp:Transcript_56902/g.176509  ORF Transcript_56902/g.176509 Transcript_56902/m.176509 type:complete len:214 (-) Transcript_56902:1717-2358(-)